MSAVVAFGDFLLVAAGALVVFSLLIGYRREIDAYRRRISGLTTAHIRSQARLLGQAYRYRRALDACQKRIAELLAKIGRMTYSSDQHTTCARCLKDKHTPLRIDAMGGYVCLACIDRRLTELCADRIVALERVDKLRALQDAAAKLDRIELVRELGQQIKGALRVLGEDNEIIKEE